MNVVTVDWAAAGLALQFVGALGILVPFAMYQRGRWSQHGRAYLWLNLGGSAILTALAVLDAQWGFVLLQGVWTLAAVWGLLRRPPREAPPPAAG